MNKTDWNRESGFLARVGVEADEFYARLLDLPWIGDKRIPWDGNGGLRYGLSYNRNGRNFNDPEILPFLTVVGNHVAAKTQMPFNYVQINRRDSEDPVHPHYDPSGMKVSMVTVGQERTFRVGGTMPDEYQQRRQSERPVEVHAPEEEPLLRHGDLLIFNGGRTLHSMRPASQDSQFNRNGRDWRFSVLFRWTTDAMRKFGVGVCNQHGQPEQYAQAAKEFQMHQQRSLF